MRLERGFRGAKERLYWCLKADRYYWRRMFTCNKNWCIFQSFHLTNSQTLFISSISLGLVEHIASLIWTVEHTGRETVGLSRSIHMYKYSNREVWEDAVDKTVEATVAVRAVNTSIQNTSCVWFESVSVVKAVQVAIKEYSYLARELLTRVAVFTYLYHLNQQS